MARFFFLDDPSERGLKHSSKAGGLPALRTRGTGTLPLSALVAGDTRFNSQEIDRQARPKRPDLLLPPMFDELQDAAGASDAFVLPSLSEGLPMALLSAWARGLPAVMTKECNVPEGIAAGAAIAVPANPESIAEGLNTLEAMSDFERSAMGARGRRLVEEKFAWPNAAAQMREVYDWILGRAAKPRCVSEP